MKERPVSGLSMFRHLLAPFAFVLVTSIVLIGGLAALAVRSQSETASQASVHMTQSVLADMARRLSDQLLDYSYWDDAVLNLVTGRNFEWADKNIGMYMHERFRISTSFVLDRNDQLVYAMVDGKRAQENPLALFSGGLEKIIERTRAHPGTEPPVPATGFLKSGRTVHIAAVSVLTRFRKENPTGGKETIATGSILMFTRALDAKLLGEMSTGYLLSDLGLVFAEKDVLSASVPLKGVNGAPLGHLTWRVSPQSMAHWLVLLLSAVLLVFAGTAYVFVKKAQLVVENMERSHSEQRELQERLRQDLEMKDLGLMAGGVAHEFNNLFQGITANLELLQHKNMESAQKSKVVDTVLEVAFKGGEMADRLLSYAGKKAVNPEAIYLSKYVADTIEFVRPILPETIEIVGPKDASEWPVEADVSQLRASMINLLLNARDAMPTGGRISIDVRNIELDETAVKQWAADASPGDFVALTVTDDGGGMAPGVLERVAQPFYTTKDVGKGTGLGLSMVYGFVKKAKGYVRIKSEVGRGTEVTLLFPRVWHAVARGDTGDAAEEQRKSTTARTILYVEDNTNVRGALTKAMEVIGYRVLSAENGAEALKMLYSAGEIDLLLTDIVMPGGMSGVELADRVRAMWPEIKIILITAYSDEELVRHAISGTRYTVLHKPVKVRVLAHALSQALGELEQSVA